MNSFEYNINPGRVVFGPDSVQNLPSELQRHSFKSPLLLCTPKKIYQAEMLSKILTSSSPPITPASIYSKAAMHTPTHITEDALQFLKTVSPDCLVSIGGGSTVGLGKALSVRSGLYHICIPTTYAGSEMTPVLGESSTDPSTGQTVKTTRSDPSISPGTVIYDVNLTLTLPPLLSAYSGINALAHSVESLYAVNTNPIIRLLALDSIRALSESLPLIVADPTNLDARSQALYGTYLASTALGSTSMSLHHKLCHVLGGTLGLPHAETHTIVLAHAVSYNAPAVPGVMEDVARVLPGSDGDVVRGLNMLLDKLGVKRSLKELGMREEDLDVTVDVAMKAQYANPRPLEREKVKEVIRRCWAGETAKADL